MRGNQRLFNKFHEESLTAGRGGVPGSEAQSWVLSSSVWISLAASLMSLRTICLCWVMPLMLRTRRVRSLFTPGLSSHSRSWREQKAHQHLPKKSHSKTGPTEHSSDQTELPKDRDRGVLFTGTVSEPNRETTAYNSHE